MRRTHVGSRARYPAGERLAKRHFPLRSLEHSGLPIDEALQELRRALREHSAAVLTAPPGAGKSTVVPLVLLGEAWAAGKRILMLEPRRLAARAVAARWIGSAEQYGRVG